jgi:predicted proteasome-type protease
MNKQSRPINNKSTQYLVPINEIRNNVIVLKNSALRSIIEVDGVNMDLLENEAQENLLSN